MYTMIYVDLIAGMYWYIYIYIIYINNIYIYEITSVSAELIPATTKYTRDQ